MSYPSGDLQRGRYVGKRRGAALDRQDRFGHELSRSAVAVRRHAAHERLNNRNKYKKTRRSLLKIFPFEYLMICMTNDKNDQTNVQTQ